MLKAVIFDLDGVIFDSQPLHFKVDLAVLAANGVTAAQKDLEPYAGTPNLERWALFKREFNLTSTVEELIAAHVSFLHTAAENEPPAVVEGIPQLLSKIKEAGLKTAVASSSSRRFVETVLKKAELIHFFDTLVCGDEVANGKPKPDIFLKAAQLLHAAPAECAVFEDSENGVAAAKAAGIKCIGYRNTTSGAQDLSKADIVIDSFFNAWQALNP